MHAPGAHLFPLRRIDLCSGGERGLVRLCGRAARPLQRPDLPPRPLLRSDGGPLPHAGHLPGAGPRTPDATSLRLLQQRPGEPDGSQRRASRRSEEDPAVVAEERHTAVQEDGAARGAAHFAHPLAFEEQATGHQTTSFQCFCTTFWSHNGPIIPWYMILQKHEGQ
jgi:hypothetical protein